MKIITAVCNNPIFIEIQYYTLQKYFKGTYEFIVFNDAKDFPDFSNGNDITLKKEIKKICDKLKIQCIDIPNNHHKFNKNASVRTADSMNYILQFQIKNPDKYLLIDSDMFLIDNFSINRYEDYSCAIVLQSRNEKKINYFWNGIYYFDLFKMKNLDLLNWNCSPGCDTGGMMQLWLKKELGQNIPDPDLIRWTQNCYHNNNFYFIKHLWSCSWNLEELPENLKDREKIKNFLIEDKRNKNNKFFCEIYDNVFLHYRGGGNWMLEGLTLHIEMANKLKEVLI